MYNANVYLFEHGKQEFFFKKILSKPKKLQVIKWVLSDATDADRNN